MLQLALASTTNASPLGPPPMPTGEGPQVAGLRRRAGRGRAARPPASTGGGRGPHPAPGPPLDPDAPRQPDPVQAAYDECEDRCLTILACMAQARPGEAPALRERWEILWAELQASR